MASDILSFAGEVGKTFSELQGLIKEMKESGEIFSFDEVKSYTHVNPSDVDKIKQKLNVISIKKAKSDDEVKTIVKNGKKIKIRKRKKPKKVVEEVKLEEPKKVVEEPKKVVQEPKKVVQETKEVVEEPKKVVEEPKKVVQEPKKVVQEPKKVVQEPKKVVQEPKKVVQEPKKVVQEPKKVVQEPKKVVQEPKKRAIKEPSENNATIISKPKPGDPKPKRVAPSSNNAVIISKPSKKVVYNMKDEKSDKNYSSSKPKRDNKPYQKKPYSGNNSGGGNYNNTRFKKPASNVPVAADVTNAESNKFARKKYENKPTTNESYADKKKKKAEKRKQTQKTKVYNSAQLEAMALDGYDASKKRRKKKKKIKKVFKTTEITVPKAIKRIIKLTNDTIIIADLAKEMNIKAATLIQNLFKMGVMATINQAIDMDTATLLANELDYEIKLEAFDVEKIIQTTVEDKDLIKVGRAPVVTVMGHVDHGKTKLLDAIRKTNVVDGEAGGITQHIGAYSVKTTGGMITFLDTPGHEAFTSMRARGANVTDIVILIVAADDGIMPQTVEAINHAQAANVPIIVAINKIDKPGINIAKIREELTVYSLVSEDWGGDTIMCEISAKQEIGIENLLDNILLQSEMLELSAAKDVPAKATVIEAFIDKGRGAITNALIQEGTLKIGDFVVAGEVYGKVRAMFDDSGKPIKVAGPSIPVSILGINGAPLAGESLFVTSDEKKAKQISSHYAAKIREDELKKRSMVSAENLFEQLKESELKELRIVVKADVQGSVEAVKAILVRLTNEEVRVNVIHAAVGPILENDVNLALASNALLIGFNVRPATRVRELADKNGIEIRLYSIIYNMEEEVKALTLGMLEPIIKEVFLGNAEVLNVFKIPKVGTIAGCMVKKGKIQRNSNIRVIRDDIIIADDTLKSLKRFKDDAKDVREGFECGLGLQKFNNIKIGDIIESYITEEVKRKE